MPLLGRTSTPPAGRWPRARPPKPRTRKSPWLRRPATIGSRSRTVVLTASNASLPIPEWAQGGKGVVYVTGCGGGASGQIVTTASQRGTGGAAAGFAVRHPMPIPAGVTTCAAVIGSGAAAISAAPAAES